MINIKVHFLKVFLILKHLDENFECFSKDQIKREIVNYKNICEKINIELFQRRGSNGSEKEYSLYIEILDNLFLAGDLLTLPKFDYKVVMKYLDDSINGIKDLQGRKFVSILFIIAKYLRI